MSFKKSGKIFRAGSKRYLIRFLNWHDIDGLHQFVNRLSKEDTFVMLSGEEVSRQSEISYVANSLSLVEQNLKIHLVVEYKGQIVGNAEVRILSQRKQHSGTVTIAIDRSARGQGLGAALLKQLIIEAKKVGLKLLTLTAMMNNIPGLRAYEKCGFVQAGLVPGALFYRGEYIDEGIYYLDLS